MGGAESREGTCPRERSDNDTIDTGLLVHVRYVPYEARRVLYSIFEYIYIGIIVNAGRTLRLSLGVSATVRLQSSLTLSFSHPVDLKNAFRSEIHYINRNS